MNSTTSNTDIKFIAEVTQVKEVTLIAEADLAFWQKQLQSENLFPYSRNGRAELGISATDLHWMGAHTNELMISLTVCERPQAETPDGLYLVQAFNSSSLFAWIERTFFHTPYVPGRIQVRDQSPAAIQLSDEQGVILNAQLAGEITASHSRDEFWQGVIFLPQDQTSSRKPGEFFVARLSGHTEIYPCLLNSLELVPRPAYPVFQWLLESKCVVKEWRIRTNAVHARSKTFARRRNHV